MHENLQLILTLTGGLAAALTLGYVSQRLRLSPLVGYLLAGVMIGPFTPGFIADPQMAEQLAEIGIILLMFGVGLNFHFRELLAVRRIALPGALLQILIVTGLSFAALHYLDWDPNAAVVFGLALSIASTVVMVRVMSDSNDLHTPAGHVAVGWLVVEDLVTVIVLVLLPSLTNAHLDDPLRIAAAVGILFVKLVLLLGITFIFGSMAIPWLLRRVADTGSRELFTLTVLVLALGIAVGSATLFGVSMALGAFLGGMVVGRSEFSLRAAVEALPMRDAFAVLFFVSVGMLFDPRQLMQAPWLTALALFVVLVIKPLTAFLLVVFFSYPLRTALSLAIARAQIGEFSFILGAAASALNMLPEMADDIIVGVAIVSISLNPLLYRLVDPLEGWMASRPDLWHWLRRRERAALTGVDDQPRPPDIPPSHRTVIVGYGPIGRTLDRLLRENEVEPTIIDLSHESVRRLQNEQRHAIYGDASHIEILRAAGVASAGSFILSASNVRHIDDIIRKVKSLNPRIQVIVRAGYLRERPALYKAGANAVFSEEGEIALAMTEYVLIGLGATPEQMDRERERLHEDLTPERHLVGQGSENHRGQHGEQGDDHGEAEVATVEGKPAD